MVAVCVPLTTQQRWPQSDGPPRYLLSHQLSAAVAAGGQQPQPTSGPTGGPAAPPMLELALDPLLLHLKAYPQRDTNQGMHQSSVTHYTDEETIMQSSRLNWR